MAGNGNSKTIAVFDSEGLYLSHCRWKKAAALLHTGQATRIDATTIRLKETRQTRKRKMRQIILKEERVCYICGERIPENSVATIDHVIPKSKNKFADVYENMRCCCDRCNADKSNMMPMEYIQHILKHRNEYSYLSDEQIDLLIKRFKEHEDILSKSELEEDDS